MSDDRKKIEIGLGEKGTAPADAEIVDGVKPEEDEVGGRYRRHAQVLCPYCYAACNIIEETDYRMWFNCWNCRNNFQY